jgi:3-dehydroquinate synthase
LVVTDANVGPRHAAPVLSLLEQLSLDPRLITLEPGEKSKSLGSLGQICEEFLRAGVSRKSPVVALGGGVVGDLAGFAAACFARGIPWISFPTTLLAQVDSSIGGKVAVNLPGAKNMVGAFHQPRFVMADPSFLGTLPDREYRSGLSEVLKAALVGDPDLLDLLEEKREAVLDPSSDAMGEVVARAIAVKCGVVAEDERDMGRRHILNLGHTFGHALESTTGYGRYLHGEAVAVGLSAALWLSSEMGLLEREGVRRVEALLETWNLPIRAMGLDPEEIEEIMGYDKKFVRGTPVFVLLEGWGRPAVVRQPPEDLVRRAVRRMVGRGEDRA